MRKTLFKAAALSVCLGLLLLTIPDLNAAPKKAPKTNFLAKSVMFVSSVFPFKSIFNMGKIEKMSKKAKITGNLDSRKISDSD